MAEAGGDVCRVTVIAPRMRLDVAVPQEVPLATLLPTLLLHCGEDLADDAAGHGGWALQRVGDAPLDTARTMLAQGVRDGDILYLRTRQGALPVPAFDDAADAITATLRERSSRWQSSDSRVAALAAIVILLAAAGLALAITGWPGAASRPGTLAAALAAAVVAAGALIGAAAGSRAFGDAGLGSAFAIGALPAAFVAGLLVLPGLSSGVSAAGAPEFLTGATTWLIAAALGVAAAGRPAALVTGALTAGFAMLAGGLLTLATSPAGAAAAVTSLMLVLTPAIAPVAYRLAGLPRPVVPATPEELRHRSGPADLADVPERSVTADRIITALAGATAVVSAGAVSLMLRQPGWAPAALAAVASGLLLLRARLFASRNATAWLIASSVICFGILLAAQASRMPSGVVLAMVLAAAAITIPVAGHALESWRPSPTLVRAADLAELLATIATVPLALEIAGVFHAVRALGG